MNPVILSLVAPGAATAPKTNATAATRDTPLGSDAFSALLAGKLNVALSALKPAGVPAAPADAQSAALEAKIAKMIKAGASEADIITTLAAQLATAVARALGTTSADARAQLEALMRDALAPPGDGGAERAAADRTQTLAQRFLQLQAIAAGIVDGRNLGQQNDIAGTFLDATSAKEHPAPASATQQTSTLETQSAGAVSAPATSSVAGATSSLGHAAARGVRVLPRADASAQSRVSKPGGPPAAAPSDAANPSQVLAQSAALAADARASVTSRPAPTGEAAQAAIAGARQAASRSAMQAAAGSTLQATSGSATQAAAGDTPQATSGSATRWTTGSSAQATASDASAAAVAAGLTLGAGGRAHVDATGDGRTVKLGDRAAVATGGDTVLGRVLTRAALAADARQTPVTAPRLAGLAARPRPAQVAVGQAAVGSKGAALSASGSRPALAAAKADQGAVAVHPQIDGAAAGPNLKPDPPAAPSESGGRGAGGTATGGGGTGAGGTAAGSAAARPGDTAGNAAASRDTAIAGNAAASGGETSGGNVAVSRDTGIVGNVPATGESPAGAPLMGAASLMAAAPLMAPLKMNGRSGDDAISAPTADVVLTGAVPGATLSKALGLGAAVATDVAAAIVGGTAAADSVIGDATASRAPTPPAIAGATGGTGIAPQAATAKALDPAVAAFVKSFATAVAALGSASRVQSVADGSLSLGPPPVGPADASGAAAAFVPAVAPFTIQHSVPPTAAPPPHQPLVDQSSIVDQVLRGALLRTTGASSEMRLSLVPASLGDVNIKLVVTAGAVSAHVVAQTPEVRDALVAAQPQLSRSLADAGLKLQSFTVDLSGGGFAGFSRQQQDGSQNSNRAQRAAGPRDDDGDDASLDAVPSFGPSIVSVARTGDYNYLA